MHTRMFCLCSARLIVFIIKRMCICERLHKGFLLFWHFTNKSERNLTKSEGIRMIETQNVSSTKTNIKKIYIVIFFPVHCCVCVTIFFRRGLRLGGRFFSHSFRYQRVRVRSLCAVVYVSHMRLCSSSCIRAGYITPIPIK